MGQINCQCQSEPEAQSISQQNSYLQAEKTKRVRTRVKSIVSPRLVLQSCANTKKQSSSSETNNYEPQFCKICLYSDSKKSEVEIDKKGMKIGTQADSQLCVEKLSSEDIFQMKAKYHNQTLYIKDMGIGLGTFKWCKQLSFPIINGISQLIEVKGQFIALQIENKKVRWKKQNVEGSEKGQIGILKNIEGCKIKVNSESLQIKSDEGFFHFLEKQTEVKESDILRCGHNFYRINNIRHYINSSRLIHKY